MELERLIKSIKEHNESIDNYINVTLAKELNAVNGEIRLDQWFKAQQLIKKQGFYEKAIAILEPARNAGYDVKINMQSYKLVLYGKRGNGNE